MKKKQYNCSRTKKKLFDLKRRGVTEVTWKLTFRIKEELDSVFTIIPFLCRIRTKMFININEVKSPLLKDIHYANKSGKPVIIRRIKSEKDIELLEKNRIQYKPINYRIILN